MLTNVNGHIGDEFHYRTRPDFTDHRPKSNEFVYSGCIRQCCWFCEHCCGLQVLFASLQLFR